MDILPFSLTVQTDKRKFNKTLIESFKADMENINPNFSYYLAGLIEGDGTIIVPKTERSLKGKINYPSIQISFDLRDLPLALIIQKTLGFGSLSRTKGVNAYRLTINNYEGLIKLLIILNGKLRTVKINDYNNLVHFQNKRFQPFLKICPLELDNSSLNQNPWLSGFIDADGHFFVHLRKNNVSCGFEIVQAISDYNNRSKEGLMRELAKFLKRDQKEKSKNYCNGKNQFHIKLNSLASNLLLSDYLENWPLFSTKFQNYQDYSKVLKLIKLKEHNTIDNKEFIKNLSENMNNNRTVFNWDHLQNFYTAQLPTATTVEEAIGHLKIKH